MMRSKGPRNLVLYRELGQKYEKSHLQQANVSAYQNTRSTVNRLLPTLRIHTWGGFGSQLYAVALYQELSSKYPSRRLKIVFHSSGITHRAPEILKLFPNLNYEAIDDFKTNVHVTKIHSRTRKRFRISFKQLLSFLGFVSSCNDDVSSAGLKPWVISIRGHYSYRSIDPSFLVNLQKLIESTTKIEGLAGNNTCTVHYRIGDLPSLKVKSLIPASDLLHQIQLVKEEKSFTRLVVYSDSPQKAHTLLAQKSGIDLETPNCDILSTMSHCINAQYFIGTSSKISFWIVGVRSVVFQIKSSLPSRNRKEIIGMVKNESQTINFYLSHSLIY
jgi:hypothetical protein